MRIKSLRNNQFICENAIWAKSFLTRMIGLLNKNNFDSFDGLLLSPCSQVHSILMKYSFDAVYLNKNYEIITFYKSVEKNKILPYNSVVKHILELPAGTIELKKMEIGDVLRVE